MKSSPQNFLEAAEFLGAKLSRDAIWAGKRCNWFGHSVTELGTGVPVVANRMCGSDYYSGTSGIAVFLGHLYAATGEKVFRSTAEGAMRQALSRLDHFPRDQHLAFQSGLVGIAHALLELARTCEIEKFSALALLILQEVSRDEIRREDLGVISGAIGPLLKIYRDYPKDFLLQLALRLGEHLLNTSEDDQASGIASAMLELYQATEKEEFQQAAERALLYQRKNVAAMNRSDLDDQEAPLRDAQVGGHGAETQSTAAVAIALLRAFEVLGNNLYLDEAKSVLGSITDTVANSLSESELDFSPARGLTGQADLLIEAGGILQDENYILSAELIGAFGIDRYKKHDLPWRCGANGGDGEPPGLMTGLAGIGYVYLRLYDHKRVPSLLK